MSGIDGCYYEGDWGFLDNETEEGLLSFPPGIGLIQHSLILTKEESEILKEMAKEMDLTVHSVLKQGLRVLQMYRAGRLTLVLDDIGGCGACD